MDEREKRKKYKDRTKISSSGRVLKPPKRIMTTSSDETPKRRKTHGTSDMKSELTRLRYFMKTRDDPEGKENLANTKKNSIPSKEKNVGSKSNTTDMLKTLKNSNTWNKEKERHVSHTSEKTCTVPNSWSPIHTIRLPEKTMDDAVTISDNL